MIDPPPFFDAGWFLFIVGLVVGLALGSFITMLSYRQPRRLSIIAPSSHCPKCKTPLKARDLVPVFSWMFSNAVCRYCNAKISARYPLIELATGLLTAAAFMCIGLRQLLGVAIIAIICLVTAITVIIERET